MKYWPINSAIRKLGQGKTKSNTILGWLPQTSNM